MVKKYFARVFSVMLALITVLSLSAMSVSAAGASLNKSSIKMVKGTSYTLKVSGTKETVKWSTSDKTVATVTSKGKVKAVGAGSAVISAKAGKKTLKCRVTVLAGSISLDKSEVTVSVGKTAVVKATVKGIKEIGYSNSNIKVAQGKTGSWENDTTLDINIKGVKAGQSEFKIYCMTDKSISKTITIKVVESGGADDADTDDSSDDAAESGMTIEEQVLYYVNIQREKAGAAPLVLDDKLCEAAKIRSDELLTKYDHTRPDGSSCFTVLDEVGFKANGSAENIAAGYTSAKDVVNGWMNSKGHRTNMLNPDYTKIGISMSYKSNSTYRYYWAQLFAAEK